MKFERTWFVVYASGGKHGCRSRKQAESKFAQDHYDATVKKRTGYELFEPPRVKPVAIEIQYSLIKRS